MFLGFAINLDKARKSVHLVEKVVVEISLVKHGKVCLVSLSEVQVDNTVKGEVNNPTQIFAVNDLFISRIRNLEIIVI